MYPSVTAEASMYVVSANDSVLSIAVDIANFLYYIVFFGCNFWAIKVWVICETSKWSVGYLVAGHLVSGIFREK